MELMLILIFLTNTFVAACAGRWLLKDLRKAREMASEEAVEKASEAVEENMARDLMDEGFENIMRYSTTGKDLMGGDHAK